MPVETSRAPASEPVQPRTGPTSAPRRIRRSRVFRSWTVAWTGAAAIGIGNAALREAVLADLGDLTAHQLSTVTLLVFLAAYMWAVERWRRLPSTRTALQVGLLWAGLTVLFARDVGRRS